MKVYTIGHSTHDIDKFIGLLNAHEVRAVADVRRFAASRRYPHFNREPLAASLQAAGIDYQWLPELGGRRRPRDDSHNTAWRNASFRGYADYMETREFVDAATRLLEIAANRPTAIMCAEALWWQCHRGLISDYVMAQGIGVLHIGTSRVEAHRYTAPAQIVEGKLTYGASQLELGRS